MSDGTQERIQHLLLSRPDSIAGLIEEMSVDVYCALRLAVELSRWPDGKRLDTQQRDLCMQAIILYEAKHLPEQDRIGFDLSASCSSKSDRAQPQPISVAGLAGSSGREGNKA
ncbi:MAG: DUF1315 family protein [Pseudohongiellaceae bacterium]